MGSGRLGVANARAAVALRGEARRRASVRAELGLDPGAGSPACMCSAKATLGRVGVWLCCSAESSPRRGCGVSGGGALECDIPTSVVAYVPYDLAQQVERSRVPLTGGLDRTEMSCGGFVGEDQRSRRAALAEKSPGDASGLLD